MATCSVADCERQHNQHRQIATVGPTVSFISLVVNSVNDQARTMFLNVQRNAKKFLAEEKEKQEKEKPKRSEIELGHDRGNSLVVQQNANCKASALSCYRKQFIAAKRQGGVRRDWMTKEAWAEVKESFSALPAQEQYHYQQLACALNSRRFLQRKGADHRMVSAGGIADVQKDEPVPVALRNQLPSFNMLLSVESGIDFTTASVKDLTSHLQSRLIQMGSANELDQYPITEATVLASLLSLRCRGIQMGTAVKHLSRTCQFLAGPKNDDDVFPEKVLYHRNCQGVCCNCYEFPFLKLQTELVDQLHQWARTYKKPSDLVRQDVLLAFDIFLGDGDVYSEFYLVTAVAFRGGVQLPVECYTKLEIVKQGEEEVLLYLNSSSPTLSRTTWPDPINRGVGFGAIQSISTVELSSHLALFDVEIQGQIAPVGCSRLTGARLPQKVVIQEFDYYDVSRTVLRLKGPTEDSKPIAVTTAELSRDTGENMGRVKTTKRVDRNIHAKERVDMLSIFDSEPQTSATSKKQKRDTDTDATIPADPYTTFEDQLTREMMEALDIPPDTDTTQSDSGPKWKRDFSGLLDPEQMDDLENQRQAGRGGYWSYGWNGRDCRTHKC